VLQIMNASDLQLLQLMNLPVISFVTGSVLFSVASIPYLVHFQSPDHEQTVNAFLAAQFVQAARCSCSAASSTADAPTSSSDARAPGDGPGDPGGIPG
jgi:hypothetical protein